MWTDDGKGEYTMYPESGETVVMFSGHRDKLSTIEFIRQATEPYMGGCKWIHGGAKGFDTQIDKFARENGIIPLVFKPDYKKYPPKVAPIIRNKDMLSICDVVIACYDGRQQGGTAQVVGDARKMGKKIVFLEVIDPISGEI